MSSFSCPHFNEDGDRCYRLQTECVPGRPGCVLCKNSVFLVPARERIKDRAPEGAPSLDGREGERP